MWWSSASPGPASLCTATGTPLPTRRPQQMHSSNRVAQAARLVSRLTASIRMPLMIEGRAQGKCGKIH